MASSTLLSSRISVIYMKDATAVVNYTLPHKRGKVILRFVLLLVLAVMCGLK